MDRRQFVAQAGIAASILIVKPVFAQNAAESDVEIISKIPPLPTDLADKSAENPASYTDTELVGTKAPTTAEIDAAYQILINSPYGAPPVDVAQYFLAVGAGAYGQDYQKYVREWPVRANPIIYHFFSSTQTKPEGDATAWCAAFLNWCLLRSNATSSEEIGKAPGSFSKNGKPFPTDHLRKYSTNSASSGSFRCWKEVSSPNRGDIVVFKDAGTDSMTPRCLGTGHVTFFLSVPKPGWVQVLGGNQSFSGSNGAVTVSNMRTGPGSRFMKYVSPKSV